MLMATPPVDARLRTPLSCFGTVWHLLANFHCCRCRCRLCWCVELAWLFSFHHHHYHCHLPPRFQRILVAQVHFCYCLTLLCSWVFFSFCLECRSFLSTHQLLVAAFWLICIFISMSGRWDFLSISAFSATHCVAKDIYVAIFTFFNLLLGWF